MKLDVRTLDITQQLSETPEGDTPIAAVVRYIGENYVEGKQATHPVDVGDWHILQDSLDNDTDQLRWSVDKAGTHVAVPMHQYLLPESNAETLMRFGAQFGLLLNHHASEKGWKLRTIMVLFSNVFSRLDGKDGYLVYVGAALREDN